MVDNDLNKQSKKELKFKKLVFNIQKRLRKIKKEEAKLDREIKSKIDQVKAKKVLSEIEGGDQVSKS